MASSSTTTAAERRINDVLVVLREWTALTPQLVLTSSIRHTLACGNVVLFESLTVDTSSTSEVRVVLSFEVGRARRTVANLREAAEYVVTVLDRGMLCLECGHVTAGHHMCQIATMAAIAGRVPTQCCACQDMCCGAHRTRCGHTMHAVCSYRVEACPACNLSDF
jgi:hypothetical protein